MSVEPQYISQVCDAVRKTYRFHRYAFGDHLPHNARYFDEEGNSVPLSKAAPIYIRCQREWFHKGNHIANGVEPW